MEEIIEEIEKISQRGYPKSIVRKLLDELWCDETDLVEAFTDLKKGEDDNRATAIFQIPNRFNLANKWIKFTYNSDFPYKFGVPYIKLRNKIISNRECSQVMISFQLWDRRRQLYPFYLDALNFSQSKIKTPVNLKSKGFLIPEEFELDLTKRLLLQSESVIKQFVDVYPVACQDSLPIADTKKLYRFFLMVKNGRLITYSKFNEFEELKIEKTNSQSNNINNKNIEDWMKVNRPPSIYEEYLLESKRLIDVGLYGLSVVQTLMVLEWFGNVVLERHLISYLKKQEYDSNLINHIIKRLKDTKNNKIKMEDKLINYSSFIGIQLNSELKGKLRKIISLRNEIIHAKQEKPVLVSVEMAKEAFEVGMRMIGLSMEWLLKKNKNYESNQSK